MINICKLSAEGSLVEYEAYYYDVWSQICYCYKDGEIVYQEYVE